MQSKKWILSVCNEKQIKAATEEGEDEKKNQCGCNRTGFFGVVGWDGGGEP